jgi:hypothetical protein
MKGTIKFEITLDMSHVKEYLKKYTSSAERNVESICIDQLNDIAGAFLEKVDNYPNATIETSWGLDLDGSDAPNEVGQEDEFIEEADIEGIPESELKVGGSE